MDLNIWVGEIIHPQPWVEGVYAEPRPPGSDLLVYASDVIQLDPVYYTPGEFRSLLVYLTPPPIPPKVYGNFSESIVIYDVTNFTAQDLLVDFNITHEICTGICSGSMTLIDDGTPFELWDNIYYGILNAGSQYRFVIAGITRNVADGTVTLELQDFSKYITDYFIETSYNTKNDPSNTRYWIEKFLGMAGVSYQFNINSQGPLMSNNTALGYQTAYDQIMQLLQMSGWYFYFDENGTCIIDKLQYRGFTDYDALVAPSEIVELERSIDDSIYRNRVIVYGGIGENGSSMSGATPLPASGIVNPQIITSVKTAPNIVGGPDRTVVYSNGNIYYQEDADRIASYLLGHLSVILDEYTVSFFIGAEQWSLHPLTTNKYNVFRATQIGNRVQLGLTRTSYSQGYLWGNVGDHADMFPTTPMLLTTATQTFTRDNGWIITITLNERCPRLFNFYGLPPETTTLSGEYVYAGTWGHGIWRKQIMASGVTASSVSYSGQPISGVPSSGLIFDYWDDDSDGLGDLYISDLIIDSRLYAAVANDGFVYYKQRSSKELGGWQKYSHGDFTDFSGVTFAERDVRARAVAINEFGNIVAGYNYTVVSGIIPSGGTASGTTVVYSGFGTSSGLGNYVDPWLAPIPGSGSRAWVVEISPAGEMLQTNQVYMTGVFNTTIYDFAIYDLDCSDLGYNIISTTGSGEVNISGAIDWRHNIGYRENIRSDWYDDHIMNVGPKDGITEGDPEYLEIPDIMIVITMPITSRYNNDLAYIFCIPENSKYARMYELDLYNMTMRVAYYLELPEALRYFPFSGTMSAKIREMSEGVFHIELDSYEYQSYSRYLFRFIVNEAFDNDLELLATIPNSTFHLLPGCFDGAGYTPTKVKSPDPLSNPPPANGWQEVYPGVRGYPNNLTAVYGSKRDEKGYCWVRLTKYQSTERILSILWWQPPAYWIKYNKIEFFWNGINVLTYDTDAYALNGYFSQNGGLTSAGDPYIDHGYIKIEETTNISMLNRTDKRHTFMVRHGTSAFPLVSWIDQQNDVTELPDWYPSWPWDAFWGLPEPKLIYANKVAATPESHGGTAYSTNFNPVTIYSIRNNQIGTEVPILYLRTQYSQWIVPQSAIDLGWLIAEVAPTMDDLDGTVYTPSLTHPEWLIGLRNGYPVKRINFNNFRWHNTRTLNQYSFGGAGTFLLGNRFATFINEYPASPYSSLYGRSTGFRVYEPFNMPEIDSIRLKAQVLKHTWATVSGIATANVNASGTFERIREPDVNVKVEISTQLPTVIYEHPVGYSAATISGSNMTITSGNYVPGSGSFIEATIDNVAGSFYKHPDERYALDLRTVNVNDGGLITVLSGAALPVGFERYIVIANGGDLLMTDYALSQPWRQLTNVVGSGIAMSGVPSGIGAVLSGTVITHLEANNNPPDTYFWYSTNQGTFVPFSGLINTVNIYSGGIVDDGGVHVPTTSGVYMSGIVYSGLFQEYSPNASGIWGWRDYSSGLPVGCQITVIRVDESL